MLELGDHERKNVDCVAWPMLRENTALQPPKANFTLGNLVVFD